MIRSAVAVDVAEIDLLCACAGSAPPFPLRAPEIGHDVSARRALLRAAGERLADRGLADEQGPLGVAEAFAYLLQDAGATLDLVLSVGSRVLGAVLLARRDLAVLVIQELTAPNNVAMAELPIDDAVDELLAMIPDKEPAMVSPFSLPRSALQTVHNALREAAHPLDPRQWEALLATNGIDDALARRLATHLQPVTGNGQAGLAERSGHAREWRRAGVELRWLDTDRGRLRLADNEHDNTQMSVNPLHTNDLHAAIRHIASTLP